MKTFSILFLLVSSSAFASQSIECTFDGGAYTLKGQLDSKLSLKVIEIEGESITNGPDSDETINNNPVARDTAQDGRSKYEIDALSSDPDYGNMYALYLPAKIKTGTNAASLSYTYVSRGDGSPDYVQGSCLVK